MRGIRQWKMTSYLPASSIGLGGAFRDTLTVKRLSSEVCAPLELLTYCRGLSLDVKDALSCSLPGQASFQMSGVYPWHRRTKLGTC
jgi:hypothetical protein